MLMLVQQGQGLSEYYQAKNNVREELTKQVERFFLKV